MAIEIVFKKDGKEIATLDMNVRDAKNPFSTGSIGYNGNGKISIDNKIHQASVNFVEVGTKGKYSK